MALGTRLVAVPVVLTEVVFLSAGLASASPNSIVASPTSTSIAFDGVTGINAILRNADGKLYDGEPLQVTFSSSCASAGMAIVDTTANTINGIASVTYRTNGCVGLDQVTATATNDPTLSYTFSIYVASKQNLSKRGAVGRLLYFDTALSASGNMSCSSCHSPANNYFASSTTQTPLGGISGASVGFRTAPTIAYSSFIPRFKWIHKTTTETVGRLGTPHGGLMWDGRAITLADQARGPFTEPHEMANADNKSVLDKLLTRPYLAAYMRAYGPVSAASNPDQVVSKMADAISKFEREDQSFRPFTSKYDRAQAGLTSLSAQELNGQALFFDPNKGGCAGCHSSIGANQPKSTPQLFSDQSYRAIGVPRNWALPYNDDVKAVQALSDLRRGSLANGQNLGAPNHLYYDLGVCGPFRKDSQLDPGLCGKFRVPTLRNIALKHSYEHNGVFETLSQVISFYINREIKSAEIYHNQSGGTDIKYNDLPVQYQGNVVLRVPFRPLVTGEPRLDASEVQDLTAFLCTLTDGYDPNIPGAYNVPAQCQAALR